MQSAKLYKWKEIAPTRWFHRTGKTEKGPSRCLSSGITKGIPSEMKKGHTKKTLQIFISKTGVSWFRGLLNPGGPIHYWMKSNYPYSSVPYSLIKMFCGWRGNVSQFHANITKWAYKERWRFSVFRNLELVHRVSCVLVEYLVLDGYSQWVCSFK